jgi:hypothetical protein
VLLASIAPEVYVQDVLPQTHALWADGRSYERYVEDFLAIARSLYGRKRPHVVGFWDGDVFGASCKTYARGFRFGAQALRAVGIGAVFTPSALRGRGYASALLGALLDAERAAGTDLAYLFSDIRPAFYERLGFITLPSRILTLRASSLDGARSGTAPIGDADWAAVRRCFEATERLRSWGFTRTATVWEWMRYMRTRKLEPEAQRVDLALRAGRAIVAYVLGRRLPSRDAYVLDEFGFANEAAREAIPRIIRAAAGDLGRVNGWLPPSPARDVLPRGSVRVRSTAITMVVPLSVPARAWWRESREALLRGNADLCWYADHV